MLPNGKAIGNPSTKASFSRAGLLRLLARGEMPLQAERAEVGFSLPLDSDDHGGIERIAFAAIAAFADAPSLSLLSSRLLHSTGSESPFTSCATNQSPRYLWEEICVLRFDSRMRAYPRPHRVVRRVPVGRFLSPRLMPQSPATIFPACSRQPTHPTTNPQPPGFPMRWHPVQPSSRPRRRRSIYRIHFAAWDCRCWRRPAKFPGGLMS